MRIQREIGSAFSYGAQVDKVDKIVQKKAIALYQKHHAVVQKLQESFVIFLDTNVLLGYYQMPLMGRKALYTFLEANKNRVYICDQVGREYKKHDRKVRRNYSRQLNLVQPTEIQKEVQQQLTNYLEENEDVLEAYPVFKKDLEGAFMNSKNILKILKEFAKERTSRCKKELHKYDLVLLLPHFQHLDALKKQEFKFLKAEFDGLKEAIEEVDQKNFDNKVAAYLYQDPTKVFPGIGDLIQKPENPYGDYCIYHEMLKWAGQNQPDLPIVFLTNDVTKRDWVDVDKRAYVHYLENFYHNTQNVFYVLHAEEIFSEVLDIPCAHLVTGEEIWQDAEAAVLTNDKDLLTTDQLQALLEELYPNRLSLEEPIEFWEEVVEDLVEHFSINTYWELKIELLEHYHLLINLELSRYQFYNQLEALEMTLDLIFE
jgi:rRNA-processing protein FCF1